MQRVGTECSSIHYLGCGGKRAMAGLSENELSAFLRDSQEGEYGLYGKGLLVMGNKKVLFASISSG